MQFLLQPPARTDPIYKIRPILDALISNCMRSYTPHQDISVDESIIGFKGRLSWIQYLPNKPTKWGLKAWVLADSSNGYVWNWRLYTGKESRTDGRGLSHHVVMSLTEPLRDKGYVFCNNFYSSPKLFADLLEAGFGACGTVRQNRVGLSHTFKTAKLQKGEVYSERTQDDMVLCLKWKDKRDVMLLSTIHDDSMVEALGKRGRNNEKPKMIDHYNLYYGHSHRTVKWCKRVFSPHPGKCTYSVQ